MSDARRLVGSPRAASSGTAGHRSAAFLEKRDLARLVKALREEFDVVAPIFTEAGIVLGILDSADEVATGYRDHQQPGHYRLEKVDGGPYFGYNNGADSPKKFLHPARLRLFAGEMRPDGGFALAEEPGPLRRLAFFGIRPCDSFAVQVLDKTFLHGPNVDRPYQRRREGSFLAVLNCTAPGNTCFCASMGTGPRAEAGYDLRLTELAGGFLAEPGSAAGRGLIGRLALRRASREEVAEADRLLGEAVQRMGRTLNTHNLPHILRSSLEHPHWDFMQTWCIGCTNCTIVCPTCFCNDSRDFVELGLRRVARERVWDSCFAWQFAAMHGANPRAELKHRYRHWVVHKLSYWVEQYGVFGCVGCGRCLTWCPVGIDITEVAATVRGGCP